MGFRRVLGASAAPSQRSAFVAECKVWSEAGEIGKAVEQLLSYLTWRDHVSRMSLGRFECTTLVRITFNIFSESSSVIPGSGCSPPSAEQATADIKESPGRAGAFKELTMKGNPGIKVP